MDLNLQNEQLPPGWTRSEIIGKDDGIPLVQAMLEQPTVKERVQAEDARRAKVEETVSKLRAMLAQDVSLDDYFIFYGSDPNEAQHEGVEVIRGMEIHKMLYPHRIFTAPRIQLIEILDRFDVADNYSYNDERFHLDLTESINSINSIIPIDLVRIGPYYMNFDFRHHLSKDVAIRIQDSFPNLGINALRLGLGSYVQSWFPGENPCPIAECLYKDQQLILWWEP